MVEESGYLVPSGIIVMWKGSVTTIPDGWALCNGSNGTPDLRDRFIVGAKQDDGGVAKTNVTGALTQSGGAATHSHAAHSDHVVTQPSNHTISAHTGTAVADHTAKNTDAADTGATKTGTSTSTVTLKTHFHNISAYIHSITQPSAHSTLTHAGAAVDPHSAHSSESNLDPYYALAFIMKL
jgi:hypothetical protein